MSAAGSATDANASAATHIPHAADRIHKEQVAQRDSDMQMFLAVGTGAAIALTVSILLGFICTTLFLLNVKKRAMARLSISFGAISMLALTALAISMYGCAKNAENSRSL